ncbi:efflux RND transporter periplasmic adaptor subunit [Mariprofundus ferrooxydans]|nr:efflux RND transporter periplasmic adaptor subunit [Mariprofundus ferrooxydans]MBN4077064.1 efflux RND transporter periplasmic adaptor subunit [Mariprofundus ferrooxydans]
MIRSTFILMLLMLVGGMGSIATYAAGATSDVVSKQTQQAPHTQSIHTQLIRTQTVHIQTVRIHLFEQSITWFGRVESRHAVQLVSRVAGRIVSLNVEDEANVDAGDMLFELAGTAVESQITDLKQQRHQADNELEIAQKNLRLIRHKQQQRLATHEQVNAAKSVLAQAKTRISKIKQRLVSLASGIRIIAPMPGVFTARSVQVGQYITPGTQLGRIVDTRQLRIRATLFPPAYITILVGQSAVIHGSFGDVTGVVSAIMPETTAEGGMQVWIRGNAVQNSLNLTPGMQLSGNIILPHKAIAVSPAAIARDDADHAFVFIRNGNRWRKQQIITGMRDQAWVEVRSGLRAGDQIAGEGAYEMLYRDFSNIYHEPD